jgi:hypothetical protein
MSKALNDRAIIDSLYESLRDLLKSYARSPE